jgi:aldehyde:ferredoxin oxidoreductase
VYGKSPATGGFAESYCGDSLATKIKGCGVDAIIIKGKSDLLTYLKIDETGVSFEDATLLKGMETYGAGDYIAEQSSPKAGVMVIGPAGENRVRFACIKSDRWRSVGRCGFGAIFGSKNLKGISFSGKKKAEIANPDLLSTVNKTVAQKGKESPVTSLYKQMGTPMMVSTMNSNNAFPTEYWKSGYFEEYEKINADYMLENCEVTAHACPSCFLRCAKQTRVLKGRHKDLVIEGPEYENLYALGGLIKTDSFEEVLNLNDVCDRLGLDTLSAGNMAAFAIEAFKRDKSDFEIDYNQPDKVVELFHLISYNKGFGRVLAKGIKKAAKELDLEEIAIHVKGLEPAGYDPRALKGMALSYATSARGACHLRGTFYKAEISGQIPKEQIKGKAELHIDYEDRSAIFDCLILCRFFRDFDLWEELGQIIEAVTGMAMSKTELEIFANTITQKTRGYNAREGIGPEADTLPERFFKEATHEGETLNEEDFAVMLEEYNQIRRQRYCN